MDVIFGFVSQAERDAALQRVERDLQVTDVMSDVGSQEKADDKMSV
jgi:hypothetical protein